MRLLKRSVSILLTLTMMFGILVIVPLNASAASGISYVFRSWNGSKVVQEEKFCENTNYTLLSSRSSNTLSSGWYVVDRDMTINDRIRVSGTVNLILMDGKTLTMKSGISVLENDTLNIFGQSKGDGKIYAHPKADDDYSLENSAVIGGTKDSPNAGNIIIHGGTLDLKAPSDSELFWDSKAACIGGGYKGTVRSVQIFGGDIKCKSVCGGAAIGGGIYGAPSNGAGLLIYGGKIDAQSSIIGDDGGAAIGGGYDSPHASGKIHIYGGEIKARASTGAAIGSGDKTDSCIITISGGYITATATMASGSSGAAIGSGRGGRAHPISISKAGIIAVSSSGAGIGSGEDGPANSVSISESFVCALSMHGGAGIGSGYHGDCSKIEIENSVIFASSQDFKNTQGFVDALNTMGGATVTPPGLPLTSQADFSSAVSKVQNYIKVVAGLIYFCTPNHSGAGIGGGVGGNADSIKITGSYVKARAEDYSAAIGSGEDKNFDKIEIINSEIVAESGDYGAAIGSGDEAKKCGTITIKDSDVTAEAGTDAAGIGTGNEADESATINIIGSTITAHGGRYGAGIGGGDAVSGGTINITDSTIKEADSKTDGAGIGGGESGSGGTITIKNSSVTAHGGGYAAGIGGGDHANGGTVTIDNSTVKAYGGEDAAGIGGGEDGDGGRIYITNGSDVYAKGKGCGAGIGGGEDSSGEYCQINNYCKVEAISGGYGNVQSIGHGDCGWYVESYTGGTLSLGVSEKVKVGSVSYTGNNRFDAIRNNKTVTVYPCDHTETEWRCENAGYHVKYCTNCGFRFGSTSEAHVWNSNNICKVCGASAKSATITIVERNNNGEIRTETKVPQYISTTLPECKNVPDGMEFAYWIVDSSYFSVPGADIHYVGDTMLTAVYLPVVNAAFIDADGIEKTETARKITQENLQNNDILLTSGWYYIESDIATTKTIYIHGHVNLIIADGKTLKFDHYEPSAFEIHPHYPSSTLSIYGQSEQSGTLNCYARPDVFYNLKQYGGIVKIPYYADCKNALTIASGSFTNETYVQAPQGVTISGGTVRLEEIKDSGNIQLGWRTLSDSIKINSITESGTVRIAENQKLQDENGNIYEGELTSQQADSIKGKLLTPYLEHTYGEPVWNWTNNYKDATATFKCTDIGCDYEQVINAKVTYEDSGKNRTSTACCTFLGEEYTATQTRQIIFDVTIASIAHGFVTANKATAYAGDSIKLDVTPDDGYVLSKLYYTNSHGNKTAINGSAFNMPESDVTVTAEFAAAREVAYIDENGNTQTVLAQAVTNGTAELYDGWHYVDGSVTLLRNTHIYGDVKLILCDGAKLNGATSIIAFGNSSELKDNALSIYRAPGENEGTIELGYIYAETVNLIGGKIKLYQKAEAGTLNVNGCSLTSKGISTSGDFNLLSGSASFEEKNGWVVYVGGNINISGGSLYSNAGNGDTINCQGNMTVTGGDAEIKGKVFSNRDDTTVCVSGGTINVNGELHTQNTFITGGNVKINGLYYASNDITLGWTTLSDSIYASSYSANNIKITDGQELTDGSTVYSGTYTKDKLGIFNGKTLIPDYIQHVDQIEPYINDNGEYIPGTIEHYATGKNRFAVNEDGSVGEKLDSVELSYFDFGLLNDGTYQIKSYTGPMDDIEELKIPMTFKGKAVTVLGDKSLTFMQGTGTLGQFTVALTKNIAEIRGSAFSATRLTAITGNTSGLRRIKDMPFFMTNTSNDGKVTISLKYPGAVTVDDRAFTWSNIVVRLTHATTLSSEGNANSMEYIITDDAHPYGDPVWIWADDYSSATAKFTCTDSRCKHEETVNADVTSAESEDNTIYTATVVLDGETYTDVKGSYYVRITGSEHGTVTADKTHADEGETVKLTATPDNRYKLKSITVKGADGKAVTVTNNSFVMPAGGAYVSAEFVPKASNISVGGVNINVSNCSDILGDGTASYDFDTNTLTLTNADIEVTGGFGIRYNEGSDKPFRIVLNGMNRIADNAPEVSGTCYGIAMYAAAPDFTISGSGTLDIEMDSDSPRCGIHVRKALTIDGVKVSVNVKGSDKANGVELVYSDSVLILNNAAQMSINTDGIALQSNRNVRNLNVSNNSIFEAISDAQAVNGNINLTDGHPTVTVNTDPSANGSFNWDERTALTSYKYISLRGLYAPCTVKWMIDDEVVETDTVPYGEMPQYKGSNPKKKADTLYTYTFTGWTPEVTAAEGDVTYMAVFESRKKEYQDGYNLTITDSIDVNIYLDIKNYFGGEDFTDKARVVLTYIDCHSEKPKYITEVIYLNKAELENGILIKTITPAFAQIGENIKVQLYGNDGELMTLANGKTEYNISVADYCNTITADPELYGEDAVRVAQAVLNYGKAAFDYFNYKGAAIDGAETAELVDYNAIPILNQFTAGSIIEKMSSSTFRAISCTELKLYITGDASSVMITKATLAGTGNIKNDCKIEKGSDGRYFVRVSNLYASELDKEITITFSDGSVKHFSVFDYIRSILKNSTSETSKRMVSALYQYNRAVVEFE